MWYQRESKLKWWKEHGELWRRDAMRGARVGMTQLKITRFRKPLDAPNIDITGLQTVSVDVLPKVRSVMQITPMFNTAATPSSHYGTLHAKPQWATVLGAPDDVKRVARLSGSDWAD